MFTQLEAGTGMVWSLARELDLSRVGTIDSSLMLGRRSAFVAALAAVQAVSIGAQPAHAAQNCGAGGHWIQTGPALGAGYCKQHHKHNHDHYVCAIGYHFAGNGRCVRNGTWWTGRRPVEWGPYYEPRNKSGSVSFQGPHGGEIQLTW